MGLQDDPFDHRITKDGTVRVTRGGRLVAVIGGADAARLISLLGADGQADQHLLARATGNYRRGTER